MHQSLLVLVLILQMKLAVVHILSTLLFSTLLTVLFRLFLQIRFFHSAFALIVYTLDFARLNDQVNLLVSNHLSRIAGLV